jgi:hypothetical protein
VEQILSSAEQNEQRNTEQGQIKIKNAIPTPVGTALNVASAKLLSPVSCGHNSGYSKKSTAAGGGKTFPYSQIICSPGCSSDTQCKVTIETWKLLSRFVAVLGRYATALYYSSEIDAPLSCWLVPCSCTL